MRRLFSGILLLAIVGSVPAMAQPHCAASDTPRQCIVRWIPGAARPGSTTTTNAVPAAQAVQNTVASFIGGQDSLDPPSRTALKDFLSILSGSLDASTLGDDGTALTFGYSLPGTILGAQRPIRLETVFVRPQLSAATTAVITDPDALARLEKSLSSLDDDTATLTFHPESRRVGLRLDPHLALFTAVYLGALRKSGADPEIFLTQAAAAAGIVADDLNRPINDLAADPIAQRTLLAALETSAAAAFSTLPPDLTKDFAILLGNQPQVYASALYHHRKDIIGPPEFAARVTWESSTRNLNTFYRSEGRDCMEGSPRDDFDEHCAAAFAAHLQRVPTARRGDRLALSLEYRATAQMTVSPTGALTPYTVQPTRSLVYAAVYGRPFASFITGKEGWIDFSLAYNGTTHTRTVTTRDLLTTPAAEAFPPEDLPLQLPPPRVRGAAALSYTQPINERFSISVAAVYTDREESAPRRPIVISPPQERSVITLEEKGMTIHVGVTYRVPPGGGSPGTKPCSCCGC
jgi:hypothetical protein